MKYLALRPCDPKLMAKWSKYMEFKQWCFETCAHIYYAEQLLKEEKVGAGLAVLTGADESYKKALEMAKLYGRSEGIGVSAKPAEHCFFRRLGTQITQTRRKLERENGLIYHQRVPGSAPAFTLKAQYGISEPVEPEFDFTPDERWKTAYGAFDLNKMPEEVIDRKVRAKHSKEKPDNEAAVEPVHEKPIFPTDKDPKNESGCVIS